MSARDLGWRAGDVVAERYRLEAELGRGAMGSVWRAVQENLGRPVALKLLLPELAEHPSARARFEREARVASRLVHPSAVRVYDFGAHAGGVYIAMELLEGHTLRALVDADRPSVGLDRALRIAWPIADALVAAHAIGLVHRDLKPENVFLERRGEAERVVVVDFGLAFIEEHEVVGRLTEEGVTAGTPAYMPPEQGAGDPVGPAADVYALGCVIYEMLACRPPFEGTRVQLLTQHLFSEPPPLTETSRVGVPRRLEDLVARMLAKAPEERPSMADVRAVLASPTSDGGRERGRDASFLVGREARMISTIRPAADVYAGVSDEPSVQLAVVGRLGGDLAVGLGANGIVAFIVGDDQPLEDVDAIYAPGASDAVIERLASHGAPVLTDVDAGDVDRVARLLRLGVSEVATRPARAASLAKRIRRAIRRARRA